MANTTIPQAVREMLAIVQRLCDEYPHKRFTLDGRLVGDIGEVLVEEAYDLKLFENVRRHHDAQASDGRQVQIKATMKKSLTFPADHIPDYYLGVQVDSHGKFVEVFNGPGSVAARATANRTKPKNNLYSVSVTTLLVLQRQVRPEDRIPLRSTPKIRPQIPSGK